MMRSSDPPARAPAPRAPSPHAAGGRAADPATAAPLAAGLNRLAGAIICTVLLLGGATAWITTGFGDHVARLTAVNAVVQTWDEALEAVAAQQHDLADDEAEVIEEEFEILRADLAALQALAPRNPRAAAAQATLARAAARIDDIDAARGAAADRVAALSAEIADLYRTNAQWSRLVTHNETRAASNARAAEQAQAALSAALGMISSATLAATRIEREIDAIARFNASGASASLPLTEAIVAAEGVPAPCAEDEAERADRLCIPSSARVHAALAALRDAPEAKMERAIGAAQWALGAYVRAGEARFADLSTRLAAAVEDGKTARIRLEDAARVTAGLNRLNRAVGDTADLMRRIAPRNEAAIKALDRRFRGLIDQIRTRMTGAATALPRDEFPPERITQRVTAMKARWAETVDALLRRADAQAHLDAEAAELDGLIAEIEARMETESEFWIGLISRLGLAAVGLLAAAAIGLLWGGRRLIVRPMTQTTSTILALARGDRLGPVRLRSHALGFGVLENSLERLRLSNIEREQLIRETQAQRREIERSMEALAETTREMERQARHDVLTGLPNRRCADELMATLRLRGAEKARAEGQVQAEAEAFPGGLRPAPADFTLMHIDVDRFKEINDTLGHDAGDAVLREVARILTGLLGPGDRAFRIGGDEFLIHRAGAPEDSSDLAGAIIEAMNRPIDHHGHACRIGASIGIAHGRDAGFDGPATLVNADIALYEAKSSGKNRFVYFAAQLQERTVNRKKLSDRLIEAIERDEFVPYYQPQYFADTLALRGVETLCRWNHPELGVLTPADFLAQAEESMLLGKIDRILLRKASEDLDLLRARGVEIPKISFNVSTDRLMHADFAEALATQLDGKARIAVELLESMSLDSISESVRWALDALKDRGIAIEIDDFGSCRASIAGLMAIGPDAMKIDGSIVAPITTSQQHLRLVKAIIDIGRTLGIETVAERVETEEHVRILRDCGCAILQGHALAHPMPAAALGDFLTGDVAASSRAAR